MPLTTAMVPVATVLAVAIFGTFWDVAGGGVPVPAAAVWVAVVESSAGAFLAFVGAFFPFSSSCGFCDRFGFTQASEVPGYEGLGWHR